MTKQFRAWDNKRGKFFKPTFKAWDGNLKDLLISLDGTLHIHTPKGLEHESMHPGRFIIEEYTGKTDRDKTLICESDLLDDGFSRWIVMQGDFTLGHGKEKLKICGWYLQEVPSPNGTTTEQKPLSCGKPYKVIGNVHQNELNGELK